MPKKTWYKEEHTLKIAQLINNCEAKKIENSTHSNIFNKERTVEEIIKFIK